MPRWTCSSASRGWIRRGRSAPRWSKGWRRAASPGLRDVRVLGAIGAVELDGIADREALKRRLVEAGVWVRPFGNVVYLTPALTIAADELAV